MHDARNRLCKATLSLDRIGLMLDEDEGPLQTALEQANTMLIELGDLLEAVVDFSRERDSVGEVNLSSLVEETVAMVRPTLKRSCTSLVCEVDPDLRIQGVANELRQLLSQVILRAGEQCGLGAGMVSVQLHGQAESLSLIVDSTRTPNLYGLEEILNEHAATVHQGESELGGARLSITFPTVAATALRSVA
ncbi:MAG: HAMP domain-containing histidine kinase [Candidatus Eremiobacteraeota bacterium]|nr:HAMP domain-containing histidine kinase [Candidatus Eremiobacteraeota bacterium]